MGPGLLLPRPAHKGLSGPRSKSERILSLDHDFQKNYGHLKAVLRIKWRQCDKILPSKYVENTTIKIRKGLGEYVHTTLQYFSFHLGEIKINFQFRLEGKCVTIGCGIPGNRDFTLKFLDFCKQYKFSFVSNNLNKILLKWTKRTDQRSQQLPP